MSITNEKKLRALQHTLNAYAKLSRSNDVDRSATLHKATIIADKMLSNEDGRAISLFTQVFATEFDASLHGKDTRFLCEAALFLISLAHKHRVLKTKLEEPDTQHVFQTCLLLSLVDAQSNLHRSMYLEALFQQVYDIKLDIDNTPMAQQVGNMATVLGVGPWAALFAQEITDAHSVLTQYWAMKPPRMCLDAQGAAISELTTPLI